MRASLGVLMACLGKPRDELEGTGAPENVGKRAGRGWLAWATRGQAGHACGTDDAEVLSGRTAWARSMGAGVDGVVEGFTRKGEKSNNG